MVGICWAYRGEGVCGMTAKVAEMAGVVDITGLKNQAIYMDQKRGTVLLCNPAIFSMAVDEAQIAEAQVVSGCEGHQANRSGTE